ncbi:unnamed protein product, partial [Allacma fusca]
ATTANWHIPGLDLRVITISPP